MVALRRAARLGTKRSGGADSGRRRDSITAGLGGQTIKRESCAWSVYLTSEASFRHFFSLFTCDRSAPQSVAAGSPARG